MVSKVWVGGGRTYRGEVDTAEISGGFQASQYELGMHTTLNTQSPFCTYSPGALTPPHSITIGLLTPVSQEPEQAIYEPSVRACRCVMVG